MQPWRQSLSQGQVRALGVRRQARWCRGTTSRCWPALGAIAWRRARLRRRFRFDRALRVTALFQPILHFLDLGVAPPPGATAPQHGVPITPRSGAKDGAEWLKPGLVGISRANSFCGSDAARDPRGEGVKGRADKSCLDGPKPRRLMLTGLQKALGWRPSLRAVNLKRSGSLVPPVKSTRSFRATALEASSSAGFACAQTSS